MTRIREEEEVLSPLIPQLIYQSYLSVQHQHPAVTVRRRLPKWRPLGVVVHSHTLLTEHQSSHSVFASLVAVAMTTTTAICAN